MRTSALHRHLQETLRTVKQTEVMIRHPGGTHEWTGGPRGHPGVRYCLCIISGQLCHLYVGQQGLHGRQTLSQQERAEGGICVVD